MGTLHTPLDEEGAWLVCRERVHEIRDGLVDCEALGVVPVARCRECRYLETLAGERDPSTSCATPDPVTRPASPLPR